jgi:hypothetical protein
MQKESSLTRTSHDKEKEEEEGGGGVVRPSQGETTLTRLQETVAMPKMEEKNG